MEIETNSDNPSNQLSNSLNKRNKLLLVIPISILVVLISIVGVISLSNQRKSTDNKSSQTENTSNINLPSKNIVVYTRCYGGERQPKHCNLYVSSLKEPEEKLIYSFDFPDVEQTDYETGFELTVNGIINKKVVYTKSYWEKKESERTEYNILGVIDLASAQDNIIYKQVRYPSKSGARDERDNDYISGIYLDGPNNKVYYSTETGPETGGKITQYGLSSNQNKVITDNTKLDYTSKVEYASSDKLYLSYSDDHIAGNYYISKILNLNSGTVTSTPKSWHNAVINKQGTKVAYIDEIPVGSNNTYNLSLNVSDLEGNNVKEIYSAPNTRLPADGYDGSYPYTVVSNYYFNEYGDRLSYSIRTPELVNGEYVGEKTTKYISILEVRTAVEEGQRGIHILPPENPNIYKTKYAVKQPDINYQWTKFRTISGPLEGNMEEGVYYGADDGWYLRPIGYGFETNEFDLFGGIDSRQIIAVKAKNLFILPN